jgi:hypothetical protein
MPTNWYVKKPIPVEAIQWTGDNVQEVMDFALGHFRVLSEVHGVFSDGVTAQVYDKHHKHWGNVLTGQYIIRGVQGEFYPIAEDILVETYDMVEMENKDAASPS